MKFNTEILDSGDKKGSKFIDFGDKDNLATENNPKISDSDNKNLIKKTNEDNKHAEAFFGVSDTIAEEMLGFFDLKDIFNMSMVNKSWYKKLWSDKKFLGEKFSAVRKTVEATFTATIIHFIYGDGNAQRLSSLIDEATDYFLELDIIREKDIKVEQSNILRVYLWCMVLVGILDIKKSDLEFNYNFFDSFSSEEQMFGYCRKLIYNYIVGDEFKDKIFDFLKKKSLDNYENLKIDSVGNVPRLFHRSLCLGVENEHDYSKYPNNERDKKVMVCFLKVIFYKMATCPKDELQYLLQKKAVYLCKEIYMDCIKKPFRVHIRARTKTMAQYLYATKDLEYFFTNFVDDFIPYFASTIEKINCSGIRSIRLKSFLPYLNKIKPIAKRYKEASQHKEGVKKFWRVFFPKIELIQGIENEFDNWYDLFLAITPYLAESKEMRDGVLGSVFLGYIPNITLNTTSKNQPKYPNDPNNPNEFMKYLFDPGRQEKIDGEKVHSFFDDFIHYFKGLEDKNIAHDKNFIREVIFKLINRGELDKTDVKNNKVEEENSQFDAKENKQNLNKINSEQNQSEKKTLINEKATSTNLNGIILLDKIINSDEKTPEQSQKPKMAMSNFLMK